jgi:hypothetical protein
MGNDAQKLYRRRAGMEATTSHSTRPYWVPPGLKIESLPEQFRVAIAEILNPAYRELVLEAPGALERATGATFVHLLWLEMLEQLELGRDLASYLPGSTSSPERLRLLDRHVRLTGAKNKAGHFLLQIRTFREKYESGLDRLARTPL